MATKNNNLPVGRYELQFRNFIEAVFQKQAYFREFFGGEIEALDGVKENENAFYVKTTDIPVAVNKYDTDGDVAFGSGTANSTRFGERTEVIYENTPVPYTWDWAFHEGLDRHTVNNDLDEALADRLELQAQAKMGEFNRHQAAYLSEQAGSEEELVSLDGDGVLETFNTLSAYFTNNEVVGKRVAKVKPELYNAIIDHPLATTEKNSSANIDENTIVKFKTFEIQEVPESMFEDDDIAYVGVERLGKAFTGINTTRTLESEDFDGLALQGAGKAGEFIPDDNKKALVKVTFDEEGA